MNSREKYEQIQKLINSTREAQKGDVIKAMGITCVINKIYYQDYSRSDRNDGTCDWEIEFVDTEGNYRFWKQYYDGGQILLKDDDK